MCNCYYHKCQVCGIELPIHLGDYLTGKDEIEVYCHSHIQDVNMRIFKLLSPTIFKMHKKDLNNKYITTTHKLKKGYKIGIRYLTKNAYLNREINHPNVGVDFEIKDM